MRKTILVATLLLLSILTKAQTFTNSNLPIVIITTDGGVEIPDDPKVPASMKIIYNGVNQRNYLTDQDKPTSLNYNGRIAIEVRGNSSQSVPKKQYGFKTVKADNTSNNNVSLLGMPAENDWILNGLAFEPSLIRDYISYNLMRQIGNYATRTVYCEVILNGKYNGLYVLQEKIKANKGRVNVTKIETTNNSGAELTGGYITKSDKVDSGDPMAWYYPTNVPNVNATFIHVLPKPEDVTTQQNAYIKGEFDFLSNMAKMGNSGTTAGFPSAIDIPSFIDFMLISELGSNSDSYQFSTYFHKDRNGKLRAGPIWDNNLTYGNDLFIWGLDRSKTTGWQFSNGDNEGAPFWKDLYNNSKFRCYMAKRWNELTQANAPLNLASITKLIDNTDAIIAEAVPREWERWQTFSNHQDEINKIKQFLPARISWITSTLGSFSGCSDVTLPPLVISRIMYNPASSADFSSDDQEFIEITNTGGKKESLAGIYFGGLGLTYQFQSDATINANSSIILASNKTVFESKYGRAPFDEYERNLSNDSQDLTLLDAWGNVIDKVSYSSKSPWPDANGNGYFIELKSNDLDNNIAENWVANNSLPNDNPTNVTKLTYFPNPVVDELTIESPDEIKTLTVYSIDGKTRQIVKPESNSYKLSMSAYNQGIYLIRIETDKKSSTIKVIKR